jgi:peptide/nickel transport system substrate-binding protein
LEFELRKDVEFQNGEEFNADVVRINWEEYKKLKAPRPVSDTALPDKAVFKKVDDYTVRFILPEPDGLVYAKFHWFFQIAPAFYKQGEMTERQWGYLPKPGPWGTGPFKLREGSIHYTKNVEFLVLEAYERYWDPRYPRVQKVIFDNTLLGNRKEAMRLCGEEEGSVDIINRIRPLDTLKLAGSKYARIIKNRDVAALRGVLNLRKRGSKWRDVRVRKAVNFAINREELWKYAAKGNAFNLAGHIPPDGFGHNPNLRLFTYDTNRAKSLLAEAGYQDGFRLKIVTNEAWKSEAQIISKMLQRIGLTVELDITTHAKFIRKIHVPTLEKPPEEQEWDIAFFYINDWFANPGIIFSTLGLTEDMNYRWIEYDSVYENMWKDMARTVDRTAQEEKIRNLEQHIYDRAYFLFIYTPVSLYAVNKEVNFVPEKFGCIRLKETSVTENHWSLRRKNN